MKIAELLGGAAMVESTVTIEGRDELGELQRAHGEIGLSIDDGKRIMTMLQELVVKQELATYALARRVCPECERLRPVKDYTVRKIRTVFGSVEVKSPRWMLCQRCLPHTCMAFTVLSEICPDQATPELMELTARLGSMLPYRKAAELLAEFLPIEASEGHVTARKPGVNNSNSLQMTRNWVFLTFPCCLDHPVIEGARGAQNPRGWPASPH